MIFKSVHQGHKNLTFRQQLRQAKKPMRIKEQKSKDLQFYNAMTSVLDLMMANNPTSNTYLSILKDSLKKWYDDIVQRAIIKNRELAQLKDKLIVYMKNEVGIVLQQIGSYLKYLVEHYNDGYMREYYLKYLKAIKKLQWQNTLLQSYDKLPLISTYVQTESSYKEDITSYQNIPADKTHFPSSSTIESQSNINFEVPLTQKYMKAKQQSMLLLQKNNQLTSNIQQTKQWNKQLKAEIDKLTLTNRQNTINQQLYLQQINKLKSLLEQLKLKQEQYKRMLKQEKDKQQEVEQSKYQQIRTKKKKIHEGLQKIQRQLFQQEQKGEQAKSVWASEGNFSKDKKVCLQPNSEGQLRLLLIQALSLQSILIQQQSYD